MLTWAANQGFFCSPNHGGIVAITCNGRSKQSDIDMIHEETKSFATGHALLTSGSMKTCIKSSVEVVK